MAFPATECRCLWIIPPAGLMLIGSLLIDAPDAGWTSYLSLVTGQVVSQLDFQPAVAWHILDLGH